MDYFFCIFSVYKKYCKKKLNRYNNIILKTIINIMIRNIFEEIKKINKYWNEFWSAREFYKVLEYTEYGKFLPAIKKAEKSCETANESVKDHFSQVREMVKIWSWAKREVDNFYLSRFACYLIIQNADPKKEMVALGQRYFAIQTRKQEINDKFLEDSKRVHLRNEMKKHNVQLAKAARNAWVEKPIDYAIFQNFGYMWLYNGLDSKWIHNRKWLKKSQKILDHMWSEELAANLFRATQTEAKLKREDIYWKSNANNTHLEVWKEVRETIKKLWGTMPEELWVSDNIKESERKLNIKNKKIRN